MVQLAKTLLPPSAPNPRLALHGCGFSTTVGAILNIWWAILTKQA